MTKFLTSARLWVALRVTLFFHFIGEGFRSVVTWLSEQARTSYWRYVLVCIPVIPAYVLVCLVSALSVFVEEVFEFLQRSVYGPAQWRREIARVKPSVPAPATPGAPGGPNIGVNPPKQAR